MYKDNPGQTKHLQIINNEHEELTTEKLTRFRQNEEIIAVREI